MKKLLIILCFFTLLSCGVEQRIKDYSYTNEWFYIDSNRYQVYKTKSGKRYIIVLNNKQTKLKRQYVKSTYVKL
jgi:hypothetical protein